ncbi:MAG TPA: prepilin-type N-terminal cleavage/methylation domain-containing protein [Amycolatopsis sp.]|nr:prepilin-type N-terminal cleavage/methylation domain-containing protein [Amycolatopsis sp.]
MLERIQEARKNQHGFTLIELLMVIVILGILAGIVVFAVSGIQDRGEASACKAEIKTVEVAEEAYYAKTTPGSYTDVAGLKGAGLLRDTPKYVTASGAGVLSLVSPPAGCTLPS